MNNPVLDQAQIKMHQQRIDVSKFSQSLLLKLHPDYYVYFSYFLSDLFRVVSNPNENKIINSLYLSQRELQSQPHTLLDISKDVPLSSNDFYNIYTTICYDVIAYDGENNHDNYSIFYAHILKQIEYSIDNRRFFLYSILDFLYNHNKVKCDITFKEKVFYYYIILMCYARSDGILKCDSGNIMYIHDLIDKFEHLFFCEIYSIAALNPALNYDVDDDRKSIINPQVGYSACEVVTDQINNFYLVSNYLSYLILDLFFNHILNSNNKDYALGLTRKFMLYLKNICYSYNGYQGNKNVFMQAALCIHKKGNSLHNGDHTLVFNIFCIDCIHKSCYYCAIKGDSIDVLINESWSEVDCSISDEINNVFYRFCLSMWYNKLSSIGVFLVDKIDTVLLYNQKIVEKILFINLFDEYFLLSIWPILLLNDKVLEVHINNIIDGINKTPKNLKKIIVDEYDRAILSFACNNMNNELYDKHIREIRNNVEILRSIIKILLCSFFAVGLYAYFVIYYGSFLV